MKDGSGRQVKYVCVCVCIDKCGGGCVICLQEAWVMSYCGDKHMFVISLLIVDCLRFSTARCR